MSISQAQAVAIATKLQRFANEEYGNATYSSISKVDQESAIEFNSLIEYCEANKLFKLELPNGTTMFINTEHYESQEVITDSGELIVKPRLIKYAEYRDFQNRLTFFEQKASEPNPSSAVKDMYMKYLDRAAGITSRKELKWKQPV